MFIFVYSFTSTWSIHVYMQIYVHIQRSNVINMYAWQQIRKIVWFVLPMNYTPVGNTVRWWCWLVLVIYFIAGICCFLWVVLLICAGYCRFCLRLVACCWFMLLITACWLLMFRTCCLLLAFVYEARCMGHSDDYPI